MATAVRMGLETVTNISVVSVAIICEKGTKNLLKSIALMTSKNWNQRLKKFVKINNSSRDANYRVSPAEKTA